MLGQRGSTSATGKTLDQMVASVAPPSAITRAAGKDRRTRSGRVTGIQSPDSSTRRRRPGASAAGDTGAAAPGAAAADPGGAGNSGAGNSGASRTRAAGAESQSVIPPARSRPTSRSGSSSSASVATCTVPPAPSTPKMS